MHTNWVQRVTLASWSLFWFLASYYFDRSFYFFTNNKLYDNSLLRIVADQIPLVNRQFENACKINLDHENLKYMVLMKLFDTGFYSFKYLFYVLHLFVYIGHTWPVIASLPWNNVVFIVKICRLLGFFYFVNPYMYMQHIA